MQKNNLLNRRNNEQLTNELDSEQFERITCSFYRYIYIEDLSNIRNQLYARLININILGRIYIAGEGINAQVSVPIPNWDEFVDIIDSFTEFKNMQIKPAVIHSKSIIILKMLINCKVELSLIRIK